jgi:CPA1 family monovalent cation:H+ antiporter
LNDGTAAVAFVAVLSVLAGGRGEAASVSGALLLTILGGALIGATVGYGLMLLAGQTADRLVELTLTTLAAYGSFLLAERFQCSGVLAAMTAGLVVSSGRSGALISAQGRQALETFWEYAAFITNSLIFILIGVQEAHQHFNGLWKAVCAAIVLVTLGRAVAIYPLCAVFAGTRLRVDLRHQHILVWGGLRGALALALALALPQDLPQHDAIITVTFAVVAFSVFVQGLSMTALLRRLGQAE